MKYHDLIVETISQLNQKRLKAQPWATCYGGSIKLNTPMIFALGFIALFTIGGLNNLLALPLNFTVCWNYLTIILLGDYILLVKTYKFEQSAGNQPNNKKILVGSSETKRNPFNIKVRYSPWKKFSINYELTCSPTLNKIFNLNTSIRT